MKRLTEKIFVNNKFSHYAPKWKGTTNSLNPVFLNYTKEIIQKYGQLEDIEDELGIDLTILFKAFKNGCYAIQNGKVYKMNIVRLDNQDKENIILFRNKQYGGECYLLKDYGKTWALTKEELL